MIERDEIVPDQGSSYVYGGILYERVSERDSLTKSQPPGIGRFFSQGMTVGAVIFLLIPLISILAHPDSGYNFFIVIFLPLPLAIGVCIGLLQGLIIWTSTRLAGHSLGWPLRALIGVITFGILAIGHHLAIPVPSYETGTTALSDNLPRIGVYATIGAAYGLFIGSRQQPWRALAFIKKEIHYYLID
jgi:hypothetical protein